MAKSALVVDDSLTIRKLVGKVLTGAGFEVIEAGDGKQALARIGERAPSLVITDVNMPIMGGIELIRALRAMEAHKFTPIICLTTETDEARKNEGRDAGATGWISKPFDAARLLRAVEKVA